MVLPSRGVVKSGILKGLALLLLPPPPLLLLLLVVRGLLGDGS